MKATLRRILEKAGVWHSLNFVRRIPAMIKWMAGGRKGPAPHPIKMRIVRSYLKKYGLTSFIETGTYMGDTLDYMSRTGVPCTSIELAENYYSKAKQKFGGRRNISLKLGNSGQVLPKLIRDVNSPVLFWLDGHYSGGKTAGKDEVNPVSAELDAILQHPLKNHVILIDDAMLFTGEGGYPLLEDLVSYVSANSEYSIDIKDDIIRLVPKTG